MISYIYDFLSILFDKLKDKEKIRTVILFGSFARGNERKDSDIDLFIDVKIDDKEEVERFTKEALREFEIKIEKSWKLKGMSNSVVPIVDDVSLEKWVELRREISSYGILLFGKYETPIKPGKKFALIEYDLSKFKQKDKMRILRCLLGYKLKKGKKVYEQKGLIKKVNAEKISNSILVGIVNYKDIYNLLKKERVPLKIRNIVSE
ncbi:MAG: nucleotidyltransferase domain-containing protein [Nanoarchaeota archaeon]